DHHAEVGLYLAGQVRHAGGREYADPDHLRTGAGEPGDDGRLEHLAAGARVAPDERDRGVPEPLLGKRVRGRDRDREGQLRGQVGVRPPAYAVRAEVPTHRYLHRRRTPGRPTARDRGSEVSASSTGEPCAPS